MSETIKPVAQDDTVIEPEVLHDAAETAPVGAEEDTEQTAAPEALEEVLDEPQEQEELDDQRAGAELAPLSDDDLADAEPEDDDDDDDVPDLVLGQPIKPPIDMTVKAMAEAIIFASDKPIKENDILPIIQTELPDLSTADVKEVLAELVEEYQKRQGGFVLESLKGQGYQFRTIKEAAPLMMNKFASRPRPLSKAAMETLAIVAYRQPVTRADVEFIRGVDAGNIIKNLLERDLIKCTGRKEDSPGKPMQFGTSGEFLRVFRLQSIKELPPLSSFQPHKDDMDQASEQLENRSDADEAAAGFIKGELQGPLLEGEKELLLSTAEAAITPALVPTEDDDSETISETPSEAEMAETAAAEPESEAKAEPSLEVAPEQQPQPKEPGPEEQEAAPEPEKELKTHLSAAEAEEEFGDDLEDGAEAEDADDVELMLDDALIEVEIEPEKDD